VFPMKSIEKHKARSLLIDILFLVPIHRGSM